MRRRIPVRLRAAPRAVPQASTLWIPRVRNAGKSGNQKAQMCLESDRARGLIRVPCTLNSFLGHVEIYGVPSWLNAIL